MNDEDIIQLFFARDERAIEETANLYGTRLHGLAERILKNREDAEESVSDTYWKAWNTIPPQRPVYFFAYLSVLCRRAAFGRLDWKNAAKRKAEVVALTAELEGCVPDRTMEGMVEAQEIGRLLNGFLEKQSPENRRLFLRRYWYADPIKEIALGCGMSENKVKVRLHRTRKKLREFLEKEGFEV